MIILIFNKIYIIKLKILFGNKRKLKRDAKFHYFRQVR